MAAPVVADGVKVAAPIVGSAVKSAAGVAAPILQDAAQQGYDAAAPIVEKAVNEGVVVVLASSRHVLIGVCCFVLRPQRSPLPPSRCRCRCPAGQGERAEHATDPRRFTESPHTPPALRVVVTHSLPSTPGEHTASRYI